jgi:hypothetical protein
MHERVAFSASSFPRQGESLHEDEIRLRIGPVRPRTKAIGRAY